MYVFVYVSLTGHKGKKMCGCGQKINSKAEENASETNVIEILKKRLKCLPGMVFNGKGV
jgi:hypothetical protein